MLGKKEINSRQYTLVVQLPGGDQQKPVGELSGGERNRVHLAKVLKSGGNVLLLDEPTNDLDVDTLRALEDALLDFAGCAVVITHDRWFLDRVATHILAFEGDSQTTWFEGTWGEYAEWVKETRGPEALEPHRIKYKPLVRAVASPGGTSWGSSGGAGRAPAGRVGGGAGSRRGGKRGAAGARRARGRGGGVGLGGRSDASWARTHARSRRRPRSAASRCRFRTRRRGMCSCRAEHRRPSVVRRTRSRTGSP